MSTRHWLPLLMLIAPACSPETDSGDSDAEEITAEATSELNTFDWSAETGLGRSTLGGIAVGTVGTKTVLVHQRAAGYELYFAVQAADGSWGPSAPIAGVFSAGAPTLAAFGGYLYMVYIEHAGSGATDNIVYMTRFDPSTNLWSPKTTLPFSSPGGAPGLAVFNNNLYLTGLMPSNNGLPTLPVWFASMDSTGLFSQARLIWTYVDEEWTVEQGLSAPSLAAYGGRLVFIWKGYQFTTQQLLSKEYDGTNWTATQPVVGGPNGGLQDGRPVLASYGGYLHMLHVQPGWPGAWWSYRTTTTDWSPMVALPTHPTNQLPALSVTPRGLLAVVAANMTNQSPYPLFTATYKKPKFAAETMDPPISVFQ